MSFSASLSRSLTIWRANQTSTPSWNTTVTAETAVRLIDRISSTRGTPFIAVSIGKVRYCSTSRGDSPGALVRIETWVLVTSGTASMDRSRTDARPSANTAAQIASTTPRRRTASSTMLPSLIAEARS